MELKVDAEEIRIGMYVSRLDIPWENSDFLFQGFRITAASQIKAIQRQCDYVYCATDRSAPGIFPEEEPIPDVRGPVAPEQPKFTYQVVEETRTANHHHGPWWEYILEWVSTVASEILLFNAAQKSSKEGAAAGNQQSGNKRVEPHKAQIDKAIESIRIKDSLKIRQAFPKADHLPQEIIHHLDTSSIDAEARVAKGLKEHLKGVVPSLTTDISGSEIAAQIELSREVMDNVVSSIIRNPGAMQLINGIKDVDHEAHKHALDVAILLIAFGRELCLPQEVLVDVGLGGLLHDTGKSKVLKGLFNDRKAKSLAELKIYKEHVLAGQEIVEAAGITSQVVMEIVKCHHERYDGAGFPNGLKEDQIGLYGHMAIIVDAYVSMVTGHGITATQSPSRAIGAMLKDSGKAYHPALLNQFIQIIGIYPIGSLVRLSTGEICVVIRQNRMWRLRPMVKKVLDKNGKRMKKQLIFDLMDIHAGDIKIVDEVEPKNYPQISANDFMVETY